jgi:hypothetical protein
MGTLRVDTLVDLAGTGPTELTGNRGTIKVWADLENNATVKGSLNVSSGTDNGTGDYSTNFTNNLSDNIYTSSGTTGSSSDRWLTTVSKATTDYRVYNWDSSTPSIVDNATRACAIGDLA